jgi:protein-L-isoaspartate O-methyltransferase
MSKFENLAGPRKGKPAVELLRAILSTQTQTVEIWDSGAVTMSPLFGAPTNPAAVDEWNQLGARWDWKIPKAEFDAFLVDATATLQRCKATRPTVDKRTTEEQRAQQAARMQADRERISASDAYGEDIQRQLAALRPRDARALVVAELEKNESDSMSDYFATSTARTVAIGWRTGSREDFRQLRKAAAGFSETAHLGPGCDVWRVRVVHAEIGSTESVCPCGKVWDYRVPPFGTGILPRGVTEETFPTREAAQTAAESANVEDWYHRNGNPRDGWRVELGESFDSMAGEHLFVVQYTRESIEHRDNYSMGRGNYLKGSGRYSSGWMVRSYPLADDGTLPLSYARSISEIAIPAPDAPRPTDPSTPDGSDADRTRRRGEIAAGSDAGIVVDQTTTAAGNIELRFSAKPSEDTRAMMKAARYRWSRAAGCWYARPTAEARRVADLLAGAGAQGKNAAPETDSSIAAETETSIPAPAPVVNPIAERLEIEASRLQRTIDKPQPFSGANPTRRRMTFQQQHANEVQRAETLQRALRKLAAWNRNGWPAWEDVHAALQVDSRQTVRDRHSQETAMETPYSRELFNDAVAMLMSIRSAEVVGGVLSPWVERAVPERLVARWLLLEYADDPEVRREIEQKKAQREIQRAEQELAFASIPGYFPTPKSIAATLAERLELAPGMSVLEPSAGSGRLAEAVRAECPEAGIECVEQHYTLAELLQKKGFTVFRRDFLELAAEARTLGVRYDRIIMNPPFEQLQDVEHIRAAYDLLKPGGIMIAIMSPGGFFRGDRRAVEFRNWLAESCGYLDAYDEGVPHWEASSWEVDHNGADLVEWHTLPHGTFKESGTDVSARVLTIRKDESAVLPFDAERAMDVAADIAAIAEAAQPAELALDVDVAQFFNAAADAIAADADDATEPEPEPEPHSGDLDPEAQRRTLDFGGLEVLHTV